MKVYTLDGQTSPTTAKVTYFSLSEITHQMASELHAIKDSSIFKRFWANKLEDLSRDQPHEDDIENTDDDEKIYTLDLVYYELFQICYSKYRCLYDSLKSGELPLQEINSIFEDYKGRYEDLRKDLDIMCRVDLSDDRKWIKGRVGQIQQYHDVHLAVDSSTIIMDIKNIICPRGDFNVLEKILQMVCFLIIYHYVRRLDLCLRPLKERKSSRRMHSHGQLWKIYSRALCCQFFMK